LAPAAASEWAGRISEADLRTRMLACVATAWAEQDSTAAAELAVNALPTGELQDRAVTAIVQRWAQRSPAAAANWVEQFPAFPVREAVVQNLIAVWANEDPTSPAEWLRGLPAGPLRDSGITAYVAALAVSSPREAIAWVGSISDEIHQAQSRRVLARLWPAMNGRDDAFSGQPFE